MNNITETMLKEISNWNGSFKGAYNIRENGCSVGRQSSENIKIDSKTDQPGLDIHILPGTKGETVSIPACVTHGDVDDLVYNDFYMGEGADVIIVAGCGVHTETGEPARHNGIHRFFLAPNSHVKYVEKHIGTGKGFGIRTIDPVTEVFLEENAVLEMDTAQIGGGDRPTGKATGPGGGGRRPGPRCAGSPGRPGSWPTARPAGCRPGGPGGAARWGWGQSAPPGPSQAQAPRPVGRLGQGGVVEHGAGFGHGQGVGAAGRLHRRVHGQLGQADVHHGDGDLVA